MKKAMSLMTEPVSEQTQENPKPKSAQREEETAHKKEGKPAKKTKP